MLGILFTVLLVIICLGIVYAELRRLNTRLNEARDEVALLKFQVGRLIKLHSRETVEKVK